MARCLLALGSNLGDRGEMLRQACRALSQVEQTTLLARSRWHETAPIGGPQGQQDFLNGAVVVQTSLEPSLLAEQIHQIEAQLGREREVRWDARVIDIDLLLYENQIVDLPSLTLPHPRMTFRRFVLEPAVEIAGYWYHPVIRSTLTQLLMNLRYSHRILRITSAEVSLAEWLVHRLREFFGATESSMASETKRELFLFPNVIVENPPVANNISVTNSDSSMSPPTVRIEHVPRTTTELSSLLEANEGDIEKKTEKNLLKKLVQMEPERTAGSRLDIYSHERAFIEQEVVAAIQSAWPDLCPSRSSSI